jgi:phage replication O-like protein O
MNHRNTTAVPNHILDDALSLLKEVELKVLLVIVRQTIGWNKDHDWIATSQLCIKTGACRKAVLVAIKNLQKYNLITTNSQEGRIYFRLAGKNLPSTRKILPRSEEYFSLHARKNCPPTKDTVTKRSDNSEKMQEIRSFLLAQGIIKSV